MDQPPEAQYQHEFYRVLSTLVGGAFLSPEYGGRTDFFIDSKKWGIVLRDRSDFSGHGSWFEADGAYGAWLPSGDMVNCLILDF